jgi:hypothetical protein
MNQVDVLSIKDSVQQGTLVELSSDYRTSGTIRAYLPENTRCAMSATAFGQHVLQGTAGEQRSRAEAMCAVLSNVLKINREAPRPWFEFRFHNKEGQPQSCSKARVVCPESVLGGLAAPREPAGTCEAGLTVCRLLRLLE